MGEVGWCARARAESEDPHKLAREYMMSTYRSVAHNMVRCFMLGGLAAPGYAQPVIQDLGVLPGGSYSLGASLSDSGAIVVGNGDVTGGTSRGFRWSQAGGLSSIGVVGGADHSYAYGVSGNGLVVVGASGGSGPTLFDTACRWTQAGGIQNLGSITPGQPSFASDASFDGSVVIGYGYIAGGAERAFRWTQATGMQAYSTRLPGTQHSVGLACTPSGGIVAGYCFNNAPALIMPTACRWDSTGAVIELGVLPGSAMSVPSDLTSDGSIVVGYCADQAGGNVVAFRWTATTGMQQLTALPGAAGEVASTTTADGSTVAGYAIIGAQATACVWVGGQPQLLSSFLESQRVATGAWTFTTCAVSSDGSTFSGTGEHLGQTRAWRIGLTCSGVPVVTAQPAGVTVDSGQPFSVSVAATGIGNRYQWFHNLAPMTGATSATYAVNAALPSDAGDYWCVVSSDCGSATSDVAVVIVVPNCVTPEVVEQPGDADGCAWGVFELSVHATGTPLFRWQRETSPGSGDYADLLDGPSGDWDGQPFGGGAVIAGADTPNLTISADLENGLSLAAIHAGRYRCVIWNDCGESTSDPASVVVCFADFDCSRGVDGDDVIAFFAAWDSADFTADINHDGGVDGDDVIEFFSRWDAGC